MQEMFQASVDGEAYDAEKFGQYFRPAGMQARTGDPTKAASASATAVSQSAPTAPVAAPVAEPVATAPVVEATAAAPVAEPAKDNSAEDILAMIRSRQN